MEMNFLGFFPYIFARVSCVIVGPAAELFPREIVFFREMKSFFFSYPPFPPFLGAFSPESGPEGSFCFFDRRLLPFSPFFFGSSF